MRKKNKKFEESILHTIVYGATRLGKTYFVKEFLESITNVDKYAKR